MAIGDFACRLPLVSFPFVAVGAQFPRPSATATRTFVGGGGRAVLLVSVLRVRVCGDYSCFCFHLRVFFCNHRPAYSDRQSETLCVLLRS